MSIMVEMKQFLYKDISDIVVRMVDDLVLLDHRDKFMFVVWQIDDCMYGIVNMMLKCIVCQCLSDSVNTSARTLVGNIIRKGNTCKECVIKYGLEGFNTRDLLDVYNCIFEFNLEILQPLPWSHLILYSDTITIKGKLSYIEHSINELSNTTFDDCWGLAGKLSDLKADKRHSNGITLMFMRLKR